MSTSKQYTYITMYHDFRPENHNGSRLITCNLYNPLKSKEQGKGREEDLEITDNKV